MDLISLLQAHPLDLRPSDEASTAPPSTVLNPSAVPLDPVTSAPRLRALDRDSRLEPSLQPQSLRRSDVNSVLDLRRSRPQPLLGLATSTPARLRDRDRHPATLEPSTLTPAATLTLGIPAGYSADPAPLQSPSLLVLFRPIYSALLFCLLIVELEYLQFN
ncbi:hypothetical protein CRG98_029287 [Punica granatum]|uniref:Uncharacterized protein n=1 Tax=Punica granatum TaxID=22663 RepID=A0A2I0J3L4_PUNGR|nr:hypothetical protein CRG98_029287 [Punica granatum]